MSYLSLPQRKLRETTRESEPILVCFEDPVIQSLFTDLLHNHGARVQETPSLQNLPSPKTRAITEVRQFLHLPEAQQGQCVVVVDAETPLLNSPALILRRPLTEYKVNLALSYLLRDTE